MEWNESFVPSRAGGARARGREGEARSMKARMETDRSRARDSRLQTVKPSRSRDVRSKRSASMLNLRLLGNSACATSASFGA